MADSFDKFSVGIDADVSALQSSLKAAQNTLAQFEGALKKATNIGEINYLSKNIDNLKGKITQLNQRASGLGRPMGDATQSLINFSRIAQDAPYGIIGVANNLNPMLESFQRLAKTEGGTKKALQAMSAGLIGPAGVGVALGIVSSLAVTFSKEIKEFFKGPTAELEEFRKQLKEVADDIYKLIGGEQTKRTKGILLAEIIVGGNKTQQEEALKELQKLYSNSTAIKNAKLGEDKAFYQTLVNQAAMQGDAVAKEKNNLAQLDIAYADNIKNENKRNEELKKITSEKLEGTGFATRRVSITEQKNRINAQYDILGNEIKKNIANLELNTLEQLKTITLTPTADNVKKGGTKTIDALKEFSANLKYELAKQLMDIETYKKRFEKLDLSYIPFEYKEAPVKESEFTKKFRKDNADPYKNSIGKVVRENVRNYDLEEKKLKELTSSYENFANMLAGNVTSGLMSVWDALEQGTNPLDAIGQMFLNIAKSIASAIIQATIFEAILTAFPELKAIFRASGALQSAFGYSGPRAAGGITNGPSMALIGEAGPEAVIPLSKLSGMLNTTFSAGAMSGGGGMSGGSFVLRGQDLLVAINRTQKSSFLKGQNISLV
jgi:Asp-tRNA(Asn)/Glu-tRNA(Gln) amidotransferase C subunit